MKLWIYKHYKWNIYEVISIARHSESLEEYIVYKWILRWDYWIRPKSMFLEDVIIDWIKIPRFKYIGNENYKN